MALTRSKVTARGQTSIPAAVRRKLGIGPGSVLEWDEEGGAVVVRKAGRYTSQDIHRTIFPQGTPDSKKVKEFDKGVRRYMKKNMRAVIGPKGTKLDRIRKKIRALGLTAKDIDGAIRRARTR